MPGVKSLSPLTHVDLFTGLGGFALALRGISTPALYCDRSEATNKVLRAQMAAGRLPAAPIVEDVRLVGPAMWEGGCERPEMLVSSFPCTGFSSMGKQQGFDDPRSALFFETLRVMDDLQPGLAFFENVPQVLGDMGVIAAELAERRGYELRWCVMPASAVGAPHVRERWFCLARRPGFVLDAALPAYQRHSWEADSAPPRVVVERGVDHDARAAAPGNALVPDAARAAFVLLAAGFEQTNMGALLGARRLRIGAFAALPRPAPRGGQWPRWGALVCGELFRFKRPQYPLPDLGLELVPPAGARDTPRATTGLVMEPRPLRRWATPRFSHIGPSRALTNRCSRDLATQLMHERGTPAELRAGWPNPDFLNWLMGFPPKWS